MNPTIPRLKDYEEGKDTLPEDYVVVEGKYLPAVARQLGIPFGRAAIRKFTGTTRAKQYTAPLGLVVLKRDEAALRTAVANRGKGKR